MNKQNRGDYGNAPNTVPAKVPEKPIADQPKVKPIAPIKK
jgi:hypothetical protein